MPTYKTPGVYVPEIAPAAVSIADAETSDALFIGIAAQAPPGSDIPVITGYGEFERHYGTDADLTIDGAAVSNYLAHAARGFFAEGGGRLRVIALTAAAGSLPPATDWEAAFARAAALDSANIVAAPGAVALPGGDVDIADRLIALTAPGGAFALIDPTPGLDIAGIEAFRARYDSSHAALYWPWILTAGTSAPQPPSGFVAGIFARTDRARGVWKAPANEMVQSAVGMEHAVRTAEQQILNPLGINCIRSLPGRGTSVWGARTLSRNPEWKYVSTRRLVGFVERSIVAGLGWVVFEPGTQSLWARIVAATTDFLTRLWRAGALFGNTPREAFFVRCDATTMTQADIADGRVVIEIGLAVIKPAEFLILRLTVQAAPA